MSTSVLSQLQAVAQEVSESKTPEERIAALTQAFDLFSQETLRLEGAYQTLQQKFATVNVELQETNRALNEKVGELDMMTTYLNSIVGNMTQGLLFVDLSGDVTTFNKSAERMLGLSYEKVLLKKYWESFGDDFLGFLCQGRSLLARCQSVPMVPWKVAILESLRDRPPLFCKAMSRCGD